MPVEVLNDANEYVVDFFRALRDLVIPEFRPETVVTHSIQVSYCVEEVFLGVAHLVVRVVVAGWWWCASL